MLVELGVPQSRALRFVGKVWKCEWGWGVWTLPCSWSWACLSHVRFALSARCAVLCSQGVLCSAVKGVLCSAVAVCGALPARWVLNA